MTSQLNNIASEIAIAKSAAASSTAKVTKLLNEVQGLKFSNNILSSKFNDLSNQILDISNLVYSLENSSSLDNSFILLNNKVNLLDSSLNTLKIIVESISGENLLEKLINVSGEIISLEEDFSGLRHNVQDLSGIVNNLTSKISLLNDLSNVDLSFVSHIELDASFNDLKSTIDTSFSLLNNSFILFTNKQNAFDSSLNTLKTIVESISNENLLEKLINVSGEIISLEQDFSGLRHNVEDLSGTVNNLTSKIIALNDLSNVDLSFVSHIELDASFNDLKSTLDTSFSSLNNSFILFTNKQNAFDSSLNTLKTIVESISGENLLEKLINVSGEIISLEQDFSGLRHNVQDLSGTVNNLTSKISALNDLSNVDLSFVSHTELDASFNDLKTTIDSSLNNISIDLGITTYKTTLNANDNFFTNSLINSNKTNIESKVKNLINILNNNLNLNINFNNL
jgi:predicted nuclease with TOPRIM domain